MIEGNATSTKNLRSSPNDANSTNLIGTISGGSSFIGSETFPDSKGRGVWINIVSINDVNVTRETWLAGWVVNYKVIPTPIPEEPTGVPVELRLTEVFSDGSKRESVWVNPTVVE